MISRQLHRNGVECIHGRFLHETCKDCRIAELKLDRDNLRQGERAADKRIAELKAANSELKAGFQGACYCCEPVGELNVRLSAENEELKATIKQVREFIEKMDYTRPEKTRADVLALLRDEDEVS